MKVVVFGGPYIINKIYFLCLILTTVLKCAIQNIHMIYFRKVEQEFKDLPLTITAFFN